MTARDREEVQAALAARRELGQEYEPALVDSFLERVENQLERRSRSAGQPEHRMVTPLILGSLGLAIPLLAIAGAAAGLAGIALVCVAIVSVNVVAMRRR
jgi:Flp pilus assembly protein TadB